MRHANGQKVMLHSKEQDSCIRFGMIVIHPLMRKHGLKEAIQVFIHTLFMSRCIASSLIMKSVSLELYLPPFHISQSLVCST